ncbi:hypothetical protein R3P38DRAFT_2714460, partial [Favolaschia claudopus]
MDITMETCGSCNEKWFDLAVNAAGLCRKCAGPNPGKYTIDNMMDPGSVRSDLPVLTQMEEILISPVHALTQVWQIHGGQYAYRGHICNFPRDSAVLHNRVPLLPEECEIIIFRRSGTAGGQQVNEDFRVRRAALSTWLRYLEEVHPTFRSRRVTIDWDRVNAFGQDENVQSRIQNISVDEMHGGLEEGPPQFGNEDPPEQTFSAGFAPNIQPPETEFEQLQRQAAAANLPPELNPQVPPAREQILTMPGVRGTPISEYENHKIAIDAFPTLFPTGQADFNELRNQKVSMEDWAAHLMRYKDGRFAQHPRFRYWALNSIFRRRCKEASRWYAKSHADDGALNVEEIREMI